MKLTVFRLIVGRAVWNVRESGSNLQNQRYRSSTPQMQATLYLYSSELQSAIQLFINLNNAALADKPDGFLSCSQSFALLFVDSGFSGVIRSVIAAT